MSNTSDNRDKKEDLGEEPTRSGRLFKQKIRSLGKRPLEVTAGLLMWLGVVLTFFFMHLGGFLVGFSMGLYFFEEIRFYFLKLRELYTSQSVFKTIMCLGLTVYLLLTIPTFIIALALGFGLRFLIRDRNSPAS